jgi:SAM-dependent methyltransferase
MSIVDAALPPYGLVSFYLTSVGVGIRSLIGPYPRDAAARIVNPLSYPRLMEYQLVMEMLGDLRGSRVLDIGSPKLPALMIARQRQCELYITDIRDYFVGSTRLFLERIGQKDRLGKSLHLEVQDARKLTYDDGGFDSVYSISVIEHIPDGGDATAMREIARVLKPNGRVVLTVPFDERGYREEFVSSDVYERQSDGSPTFYQRHYDMASVFERLVKPSGLRLERITWFGEPRVQFEKVWNAVPMNWKIPLLWAQPFLAKLFLKRLDEPQRAFACGVALSLVKDCQP